MSSQVVWTLQGRSHRCFKSSDTANWFWFLIFGGECKPFYSCLCHAKNLPELKTWFRNIIRLEWEGGKLDKYVVGILRNVKNASMGGKLDKYVGTLRVVKNALILVNGNKIKFHMSVELYPTWEPLHTVELHGELLYKPFQGA